MVNWIVTVTDEGAALIASVIASQGTLNFTEARISDVDYYGDESSLTEATFAGVYLTTTVSASIVDLTKIKMNAMFDLSGLTEAHDIATVGFIANDGGSDVLLAVLTTEDAPDTAEPGIGINGGYIAFNINLAVSSTQDITVVGTTAAVLYDTDIVNHLNSTDATKPLSANMGRVLNEKVESLTNPNILDNPFFIVNTRDAASYTGKVYGVDRWKGLSTVTTITPNNNGINVTRPSGDYWVLQQLIETPITEDTLTVSIKHENGISAFTFTNGFDNSSQYDADVYVWLWSNGVSRAVYVGIIENSLQIRAVKLEIGSVSTIHIDVPRPYAIELARCQTSTADPTDTYANKGNLVNYSDIATIQATGSTNTTGATITAGTKFYLNGSLCAALSNIGNGSSFTLNTNYKITTESEWVDVTSACTIDANATFENTLHVYDDGSSYYIKGSTKNYMPNVTDLIAFPKNVKQYGRYALAGGLDYTPFHDRGFFIEGTSNKYRLHFRGSTSGDTYCDLSATMPHD